MLSLASVRAAGCAVDHSQAIRRRKFLALAAAARLAWRQRWMRRVPCHRRRASRMQEIHSHISLNTKPSQAIVAPLNPDHKKCLDSISEPL